MTLKIGDEILEGKYVILDVIGEGRFGTVYRAYDQYLDVDVAIKELKREDLTDELYADFLKRFRREARIGRELRHEHIVHVSTLERIGDDYYLVMDYIDGPSLAERLDEEGPFPVKEAVEIAIQLCDGLAVVHDHRMGIVHRDIKPSNILLTRDLQAKITDFGLAQLAAESGRSLGLGERHPGTPLYMSPEQGTSSDYLPPASDIYSTGCVLFEMLTGKMYKRVEGSRPSEWRAEMPRWLDDVLGKMLAVERRSRYQEALQVKSDLGQGLRGELKREQKLDSLVKQVEEAVGAEKWREAIKVCEEGLELEPGHTQLENLLDEAKQGQALEQERTRKEKDGKRREQRERIDQLIEAARARIRVVAATMANPVGMGIIGVSVIACVVGFMWLSGAIRWPPAPPAGSPTQAKTWAAMATATGEPATVALSPSTGAPTSTALRPTEAPTATSTPTPTPVPPTATATHTPTTPSPTTPASLNAPTGRIAFVSSRNRTWDIYVMNPDGTGVSRITKDAISKGGVSWSPDGAKFAFCSYLGGSYNIWTANIDGTGWAKLTDTAEPVENEDPTWSPEGTKIAFASNRDGDQEIYTVEADGSRLTQLTNNSAHDMNPAWSPDGSRIAFNSDRETRPDHDIYVMNSDGSNQVRLTTGAQSNVGPAWAPEGNKMAFSSNRDGNFEIYVMKADGSQQVRLTTVPNSDWGPAWSPDGRWLAFEHCVDGTCDVYLINADGTGIVNLTNSPGQDAWPSWMPG